ncbi:arabinan endo-1,5-alpha-L-arabinosidase [Parvularcula oceani]|uniref:arabinan endo-1,5-alpha-L-arabinosidase n=1 Tax=Parvularcula oceani TaxID=1247963 RepID=UPI00056795FD|nr:arabinan endo-1,5-alpha-L-arabinosidase [Parvularcula oceani]
MAMGAAFILAGLAGLLAAGADGPLALSGDVAPVHDPVVLKDNGRFHLFNTSHLGDGPGLIAWRTSPDLRRWSANGAVFQDLPEWARDYVPGTRGLWAPDVIAAEDEVRVYYSVSTFGKNRSAIGLVTTPTLDESDPGFGWTDRGMVYASDAEDDFNAIDPNILIDGEGRHWMSFGSFWTGLKIIELDPATGKPLEGAELIAIAKRHAETDEEAPIDAPNAIEAPFIVAHEGDYYLFASRGFCCRGEDSTYNVVVGRAEAPTGPYLDRQGIPMTMGGGTQVLSAADEGGRFAGPGHNAVLQRPSGDYILYHAYDTEAGGRPTLRIRPLSWGQDGWPSID